MELEDSGRTPLAKDERRWPEVQAHLMGQALGGLKLLTIARGIDEAFDDIHPKRLRRLHVGPMYSHAYTSQSGPIRDVLAEAHAPEAICLLSRVAVFDALMEACRQVGAQQTPAR